MAKFKYLRLIDYIFMRYKNITLCCDICPRIKAKLTARKPDS